MIIPSRNFKGSVIRKSIITNKQSIFMIIDSTTIIRP